MNRKLLLVLPFVWVGLLTLSACSDDDDDNNGVANFDASSALNIYATEVISAIYADLATEAGDLETAVNTFSGNINETNLTAAQQAWIDARIPWENSEAFLFGPVDTSGFDPRLDSWPVNRVDLDAVLTGSDNLTENFVANLSNELRGFHTIEYLLFDDGNGSRVAADIVAAFQAQSRRVDYLVAVTANIEEAAGELSTAWQASGGDFQAQIINAGTTSTLYPSQKSALQEMVEGMIGIADEVGNGKISDPFSQQDTELVESQFSFNSIADFQNNIRGIQHVYLGNYTSASSDSLSDYVATRNASLDTRFKTEVQAAIDAIGAITPPFRDAITQNQAEVQAAIDAVNTVQETLENDILPLITSGKFSALQ